MKMPYSGKFKVTSPFGTRIDPITGERGAFHSGIDLVSLEDKEVRCVAEGEVVRSRILTDTANKTSEWGNYVAVQADGEVYYYCHLSSRLVSVGEHVKEGDIIGLEGSTGRSTGSHLHLEIRCGEQKLNPAEYLQIPNRSGYIYTPIPQSETDENPSTETKHPNKWAEEAVTWANESGIIKGNGDGILRLGDSATREEVAVMLHRLYCLLRK